MLSQITNRKNVPDTEGNWGYREIELLRLDIIDDYNHGMDGVDMADQKRQVCDNILSPLDHDASYSHGHAYTFTICFTSCLFLIAFVR
jgi:hypothetical protein